MERNKDKHRLLWTSAVCLDEHIDRGAICTAASHSKTLKKKGKIAYHDLI